MSQGRTGEINYRCPSCLFREIDYDLLFDFEHEQYYCRRCNWEGDESEILLEYAFYRKKYRSMLKRFTEDDIIAMTDNF